MSGRLQHVVVISFPCHFGATSHVVQGCRLANLFPNSSQNKFSKCPNILETGVMMKRQNKRRAGTNEAETHPMLVKMILTCTQLCWFFAVNNWIQKKVPPFHPRIESGRSHSVSPPCATGLCNGCQIVHRFVESKKKKVEKQLRPGNKNSW